MPTNVLVFLPLNSNGSGFIGTNEVKLMVSKTSMGFHFSKTTTAILKEGGYDNLRFAFNPVTGELFFVFCKERTQDSMTVDLNKRLVIRNKYLISEVEQRLGIDHETRSLKLSDNMSNSADYITYKISKK